MSIKAAVATTSITKKVTVGIAVDIEAAVVGNCLLASNVAAVAVAAVVAIAAVVANIAFGMAGVTTVSITVVGITATAAAIAAAAGEEKEMAICTITVDISAGMARVTAEIASRIASYYYPQSKTEQCCAFAFI